MSAEQALGFRASSVAGFYELCGLEVRQRPANFVGGGLICGAPFTRPGLCFHPTHARQLAGFSPSGQAGALPNCRDPGPRPGRHRR